MANLQALRERLPSWRALDILLSLGVAKKRLGYFPNMLRPATLNEHIIYGKLHFHGDLELARHLTDKQKFKDWLRSEGLENLIVPTVGVYTNIEQLISHQLVGNLVIKPTHASGKIMIKHDAGGGFLPDELLLLKSWLSCDYYLKGREPNYRGLERKIIAEELLSADGGAALPDYKFFCGGGKVFMIQVDVDRFSQHRRTLFTVDWDRLPYSYHYPCSAIDPEPPSALADMIEYAQYISRRFRFCRVDLYVAADQKIKAGEVTFFPENGFGRFSGDGDAYCGALFLRAVGGA